MEDIRADNYKELMLAVVKRAYDDLVYNYKKLLALHYPNHGENTRNMYKHLTTPQSKNWTPNVEQQKEKAKDEIEDCKEFFRNPADFRFYFRSKDIVDAEKIIKQAQIDAAVWFADKDVLVKNRHTREQDKRNIKALKKYKKRSKKNGK